MSLARILHILKKYNVEPIIFLYTFSRYAIFFPPDGCH